MSKEPTPNSPGFAWRLYREKNRWLPICWGGLETVVLIIRFQVATKSGLLLEYNSVMNLWFN